MPVAVIIFLPYHIENAKKVRRARPLLALRLPALAPLPLPSLLGALAAVRRVARRRAVRGAGTPTRQLLPVSSYHI